MIVYASAAAYLLCSLISGRFKIKDALDWAVAEKRDWNIIARRNGPIVLTQNDRLNCAFIGLAQGVLWPLWLAAWFVKKFATFILPAASPLEKLELQKAELAERGRRVAEAERLVASYRKLPDNQ